MNQPPTNHAILTFQPDSASAAAYNLGPLMPAAPSCSMDSARIRGAAVLILIFLVTSSLGGAFAVRDSNPVVPPAAALSHKGTVFVPKRRMPVPPSGPSRRHNRAAASSAPGLLFEGSKRLVPDGPNPLHN